MSSTTPAGISNPYCGQPADAFAERVLASLLGAMEIQSIYLGDRLGFYRSLAADGPATSSELAARAGVHERYAREWLEQQAVNGIVLADDESAEQEQRRYTLPDTHAEVLADESSLAYMAPFASLVAATGRRLDALVEAYRAGGGVSWDQLGDDARQGQGGANRPLYLGPLAREYLPSLPEVDAALRAGGRVADVGCGFGWSSIGIAKGYPSATVHGYDIDRPSIERARAHAEAAGVADRVEFFVVDAATVNPAGGYDLVTAFECIHDLPDPVSVLAAMRALVKPGGTVLVMDERVAERFTAPADEVERLMYGFSILCCLPDGMSRQPSAATGTVMRPATLEKYARAAGFDGIEILPIENDFFRFYKLV
jgi:2-polyprenyl-3-methyl-5-hydroxy-6-metoxy-1,4-benzoquinol methylase